MIENSESQKPRLVPAGGAFSVIYKNRSLYSRYAPEKSILAAIEKIKTRLLPGTLLLCCSPCLWYGLPELLEYLPENSLILGCEFDQSLYELAKTTLKELSDGGSLPPAPKSPVPDGFFRFPLCGDTPQRPVILFTPDKLYEIPALLQNKIQSSILPPPGTFKRIVRIDFSAGIQFFRERYSMLESAAESTVAQFWKNRLTLVQFGRKYSADIFRNLAQLPYSVSFEDLKHTIEKPILIFGAGESIDHTLKSDNINTERFYIIAVDAALPCLLKRSIVPDAVISMECQNAVLEAFMGAADRHFILITDMAGIAGTKKMTDGPVCFFLSRFDDAAFLANMEKQKILPQLFAPLGSVGLAAVETAIFIRKDNTVPIFVTGMDFSYTKGLTHAKDAPAHSYRISTANRLVPILNTAASFVPGAEPFIGKNEKRSITTPALKGYAAGFSNLYRQIKNLYDIGASGMSLGIQKPTAETYTTYFRKSPTEDVCKYSNHLPLPVKKDFAEVIEQRSLLKASITNFYTKEEKALLRAKDILIHGQHIPQKKRNTELNRLLSEREYLYLHFPDGYRFSLSSSFLKRIRVEIDFFLKVIAVSKRLLQKSDTSGKTEGMLV